MDVTLTNNVSDVYGQGELIEKVKADAFKEGMGRLHITADEHADSPIWYWTVTGEDGKCYNLQIDTFDQIDRAALPALIIRRRRELLAA